MQHILNNLNVGSAIGKNNPKKASKVVNEDGTPKAVYHGTDKGGFYVFDPKMSDDKISLFFF